MATNLIIAYDNLLKDTAIGVSTDQENLSFPALNVITDQRQVQWRTTDATPPHWVEFDLLAAPGARAPDLAVVWDLNVEDDGTAPFEIDGGATSPPATFVVIESTNDNLTSSSATVHAVNRSAWSDFESARDYRYWRFYFTNAPALDSVFITGKIFLGRSWRAAKNYDVGIRFSNDDLSTRLVTPNGAVNVQRRPAPARVDFAMSMVPRSEAEAVRAVFDVVGNHSPVSILFDVDNDYARHSLYGYFTETAPKAQRVGGVFWDLSFSFEEAV